MGLMHLTTKNNNTYYFSYDKKEVLLLSSTLKAIMENDADVMNCSDYNYYKKKYLLLKSAGYFDETDINEVKKERYSPEVIEKAIANSTHIVLETTQCCNLNCKYCGYGELYSTFGKRTKSSLSFNMGKGLIDYLQKGWNSLKNESCNRRITIAFYGGEPLLNFDFIKKIVLYLKDIRLKNNYISYSITTNGVLLDKYMDFLVEWDFSIFISLDGNLLHNGFRVYPNGKESFSKVYKNVEAIKTKYPEYFKKNVFFNSVFHSKSSFLEVNHFFGYHFDKSPQFLMLNTYGVNKDKREEFEKVYKNPVDTWRSESECDITLKNRFSSITLKLFNLLQYYCKDLFYEYNALRFHINNTTFPTGTCIPFKKKIYLTSEGKILPCEKISSKFVMGEIKNGQVILNCEEIASFYNNLFDNITSSLCKKCYNVFCESCVFTIENDKSGFSCRKFMTEKAFNKYVKDIVEECEENPLLISEVIENNRKL